jgi:hypothetical protein
VGSHIGNDLGHGVARRPQRAAGASPVDRLELVAAVMALPHDRLHAALCALWPDDTHAGRAAVVMADAIALHHPIIDDAGRWHARKNTGGHEVHDPRHRAQRWVLLRPTTGRAS